VVIVVIVFLQTWRASIIPLIAVPVSLIGTFAVMHLLGFGLNALSLFGLVLAIGIVVDDAIVVVENVERNIHNGLTPMDATRQAMREVTSPIIATALVLCAVFVPTAFISGLSGEFYKQFALTIAISTIISAFNSLTLSPALSALLLKPQGAAPDRVTRILNAAWGGFSRRSIGSSRAPARATSARWPGYCVRAGSRCSSMATHSSDLVRFRPHADRLRAGAGQAISGRLCAASRCRDPRSHGGRDQAHEHDGARHPGVESVPAFPGLSINGFTNATNAGIAFTPLKPFEERRDPAQSAGAIAAALTAKYSQIQDAYIAVFPPPPVQGLGQIGGFKLQIEDRGNQGPMSCIVKPKMCWPRRGSARSWPAVHGFPSQCTADSSRRGIARSSRPPASMCRTSSTPCRCIWAPCTSMTSTASAAPTRSTHKRSPAFA